MDEGTDHAVVVVGGGPTGMMLGAELTLAGIDVVVLERRPDHQLDGSRAGGLHARTLEVLEQRGVADRFLAEGQIYPFVAFSLVMLPIDDFPTRHPHVLGLWQRHIERIMSEWIHELGVPVRYSSDVVDLVQDADGVDVRLSDGASTRAAYVVGCDGGRSVVRKAAGIDFPGLDATTSWMLAEVEMDREPESGIRRDGAGVHGIERRAPDDPIRVVITEREVGPAERPTIEELRAAILEVWGDDFGLRDATWISRFSDVTRQAATYRQGRVLLAGDAAHIHPPQGGQGLNTGVQDAVNLGWKLAQVVNGSSPDSLLDTYHDERHPVGARVVHNTNAQVALATPDPRHEALREILGDLLTHDDARRQIVGMLSGLDIAYDLGGDHPLVGRRMPDLDVETASGPTRVSVLLRAARPILLDLGSPGGYDPSPWGERVTVVSASTDGPWELPVIGAVDTPAAVLVRPDGYVAWVGETADPELPQTIERWFGRSDTG